MRLLCVSTRVQKTRGGFSHLEFISVFLQNWLTNKEIIKLNDTIDLIDLTDVYRVFHPKTPQYTFFSVVHGTFSEIDHILGCKASLNKYRKLK
jgi:exonuclease III